MIKAFNNIFIAVDDNETVDLLLVERAFSIIIIFRLTENQYISLDEQIVDGVAPQLDLQEIIYQPWRIHYFRSFLEHTENRKSSNLI